jgi:PAS domain S-box-containing protein
MNGKEGRAQWIFDVSENRIHWSSELASLFDWSADRSSIDLDMFLKIVHPDDAPSVRRHVAAVLRTKEPMDIEFKVASHGDNPKWIDLTGILVTDAAGNPTMIAGCARDVTRYIRAEKELDDLHDALQRTKGELSAARKELESFSYHVSHDMQAPLRSIIGFSEAVQEDYSSALDKKGKDYLGRVVVQAKRLNAMLSSLLLLSRASSRQMVVQMVNLSKLAHDIELQLRRDDPGRKAEFVIEENIFVTGDRDLLGMAMQCMLENAWKFSSKKQQGRIEFRRARIDGIDCFFVRDNGAGFNPDYSERLFIPFQRLHTQDEFPGEGVGLALVHKIIQRHSGKVWVHSEEGEGATFYFTLGLRPPGEHQEI